MEKSFAARALVNLENLCSQIYPGQFQTRDYMVLKDLRPWRLGAVFVQELYDARISYVEKLFAIKDEHLEILNIQDGIVEVLKFDPKKPRVPWGEPAETVENVLCRLGAEWLATGRSARTVRGVLRKFTEIQETL